MRPSHSLTALSAIVSNTGCTSVGEIEITRRISAVAVRYSRDSVSSRVRCCSASNSRAFSIAITAWSANVVTSSICLSVKRSTRWRARTITPIGTFCRKSGTPSAVRALPRLDDSGKAYSGSVVMSSTWTTRPSRATRAVTVPRPGEIDTSLRNASYSGENPNVPRQPIDFPFAAENQGHFGAAEMRGGLDERVENGLQLGNRAADHLEHVGGGRLLLERFA